MSFTPGPWKNDGFMVSQVSGQRLEICHTGIIGRNKPGEQAEADAKLIAAAPELLEALMRIRSDLLYEHGPFAYNANFRYTEAAIDKAVL